MLHPGRFLMNRDDLFHVLAVGHYQHGPHLVGITAVADELASGVIHVLHHGARLRLKKEEQQNECAPTCQVLTKEMRRRFFAQAGQPLPQNLLSGDVFHTWP